MRKWTFSESLGRERLETLKDPPPFEEIAKKIVTAMRPQCSHVDPCDQVDGFKRFVACIVIDKTLFDLFFNSYNGYRGWYFRSPKDGLQMNGRLLQVLAPHLLAIHGCEDMPVNLVSESLLASSAKCWLAEVGKGFCQKCEGDWSKPGDDSAEILNDRWELADVPNARFGRKAPYLEKVRVIGAFVNHAGKEHVVKPNRAQEIYDAGWS